MTQDGAEVTAQIAFLVEDVEKIAELFVEFAGTGIRLSHPIPPGRQIAVGRPGAGQLAEYEPVELRRAIGVRPQQVEDDASAQLPPDHGWVGSKTMRDEKDTRRRDRE